MKNLFVTVFCFCAISFFASCGSSQKMPQASQQEMTNPYGQKVQLTETEEYAAAMPGKRAAGKGVSFDESSARELAEMDARAQFSRAIDAAVISAAKRIGFSIDQYAGGDEDGMSATDGGVQTNTLSKSISSNIVSKATVVKSEKFYGKNRKYTIFVCLEYNGSVADIAKEAVQQVKQRVSDTDRAKIQKENARYENEVMQELQKK